MEQPYEKERKANYTQMVRTTDANPFLEEFIEKIIERYNLKDKREFCEIKYNNCERSDDHVVYIICHNRMVAVGISRRTDLNYEEFTLIDLEHKFAKR